jgi:hypothetical protein
MSGAGELTAKLIGAAPKAMIIILGAAPLLAP